MSSSAPREFTGRHMLIVLALFFGTIIAVNVTMAVYANTSWTGLVVKNSYVASQEFNEKAALGRAQSALGWRGTVTYRDGRLSYSLANAEGAPVTLTSVKVTLRRPAYEAEDMTVELQPHGNAFSTPVAVRDGIWIIDVEAGISGRAPYHDISRHHITNGTLQ
ncbi:cytochrome oxidase [Paramesorhizobium deserti]|uniref:Cytochrome oxidase n=1 Tax=Paramesorhizobium deserti TaxID=1494590 RepID=A0A135HPI5_9HYPH|nr:FixH family protein [Paramesorhizobium deserti]KXF75122.1 cytochrome oxidase [Paramesorhizobium deserti]